jgi:hypothetical protein
LPGIGFRRRIAADAIVGTACSLAKAKEKHHASPAAALLPSPLVRRLLALTAVL